MRPPARHRAAVSTPAAAAPSTRQAKSRPPARPPPASRRRPARRVPAALDAAQPFDSEARAAAAARAADKLTIGVVGFGTFGAFLAGRLVAAGHRVVATSRSDRSAEAAALGVGYYADADDFCEVGERRGEEGGLSFSFLFRAARAHTPSSLPPPSSQAHPDVVILATSILSTNEVLHSLPLQRLKR
jgi:arogenate dehydrogenase (NADP+)